MPLLTLPVSLSPRTSIRRSPPLAIGLALLVALAFVAPASSQAEPAQRHLDQLAYPTLQRFGSKKAFQDYVRRLRRAYRVEYGPVRSDRPRRRARKGSTGAIAGVMGDSAASSAPAAKSAAKGASAGESITNTQEANVDEGGIVKVHGKHLVILRRGRLFTTRITGDTPQPIAAINVFPGRENNPPDTWYDELLVSGNTAVVIGYSYDVEATEIGLFRIGNDGSLRHRKTHFIRSNDYYSSQNYASRLIGNTLILYTPHALMKGNYEYDGIQLTRPSKRAWTKRDQRAGERRPSSRGFNPLISWTRVVRPIQTTLEPMLHTVIRCNLASPAMRCTADAVIGPESRSFYVASDAVYLWVGNDTGWASNNNGNGGIVYRMPLRGGAVGALRVHGGPVDQFSFRARGKELQLVLRDLARGDGMWQSESSAGGLALLRVPVRQIAPRARTAERRHYTLLTEPKGGRLVNRFIGDHLLYGTAGRRGRGAAQAHTLHIHPLAGKGSTVGLTVPHGVERLEVMGSLAMAVGSGSGGLVFSAVSLDDSPAIVGQHIERGAKQGEQRSHGFFYRPTSADAGLLALPYRFGGRGRHGHLRHGSAGIVYLAANRGKLTRLGVLESAASGTRDDHCLVSCTDWYGNARPIFLRGRTFARLGYELVEGAVAEGMLVEKTRINLLQGLRSGPALLVEP